MECPWLPVMPMMRRVLVGIVVVVGGGGGGGVGGGVGVMVMRCLVCKLG